MSGKKCLVRWSYWAIDEFEVESTALVSLPDVLRMKEMAKDLDNENELRRFMGEELVEAKLSMGGNLNHIFRNFADLAGCVTVVIEEVKSYDQALLEKAVSSKYGCELIELLERYHCDVADTYEDSEWTTRKDIKESD